MGQSTSLPQLVGSMATKLVHTLSGSDYNYISPAAQNSQDIGTLARWRGRDHLVYSRMGSQYFDSDGDLAHEFYEEGVEDGQLVMRRKMTQLTPQGRILYRVPRLHTDFPCVIMAD
eukprot:GFUD01016892.1.p1 GENE.GFUD01016892.1~~GFUD01016892.1.p1  ORF type:complete len:116 (+),score=41.74 GFUD01016892.1:52-399(+)